jgi:hypothetical protein
MGHNILLIDSDVAIHTDVYAAFKSYPFNLLNHICGLEAGDFSCNGGSNYFQNADPSDGPVAWMLLEFVDRVSADATRGARSMSLRWMVHVCAPAALPGQRVAWDCRMRAGFAPA